ncbi:ATP-dependent protease subunit HslV [Phytophthora nicotianae CJ01A1]|uniref:ATP-dependent protease subunit HslV n=5 Tax=Phytophthora nicotianae TaxID=4792 RepID=W2QZ01_PHYN3|nr:ATP-dependent protease subunit HslV [Phytophthora nicotianae INRA-310]ETK74452.1 ATP-dependent protease subunit HslV [Phytophthora nicotianae]ETO62880.1 ATP-dependent protease subunit HslV [Phytophthora nicotianae P1976]ETP03976.1 ATP-dependent protease subunit HslV [Phytophthora nicotianae CJ01A1]ETP32129.1 ATP-dependent protease subunit HslV [Phytophthora nicotianae P10297]KUF87719.1 ATP-dependent protease hslV [Phytophthora nicotianae]
MLARSLFRAASSARKSLSLTAASANFGATQVARFSDAPTMHGTTILCVRKNGKVCLIGDGQVSLGHTVVKPNAKKVRRIGEHIVAGFAGSTADAFTLMERLEAKLDEYPGQLTRSCVELAKDWRTDKYLRRLEAILIVSDINQSYTLTGNGDVLEPHDGIIGIGSGGTYALAAARALIDQDLDAETIARKSMKIAADICVYTNGNVVVEMLEEGKDNKEENKEE